MCFIANDNTPKINSEPSLDDCGLTIHDIGDAFVELSNNYDFLKEKKSKNKKRK